MNANAASAHALREMTASPRSAIAADVREVAVEPLLQGEVHLHDLLASARQVQYDVPHVVAALHGRVEAVPRQHEHQHLPQAEVLHLALLLLERHVGHRGPAVVELPRDVREALALVLPLELVQHGARGVRGEHRAECPLPAPRAGLGPLRQGRVLLAAGPRRAAVEGAGDGFPAPHGAAHGDVVLDPHDLLHGVPQQRQEVHGVRVA
mmetsp:Transcript_89842/g.254584  ORF Transcript_89842/g.254584 Transcript_89842/m.254584 type:complete len:208 (-) Transcript_89842:161-784(-)